MPHAAGSNALRLLICLLATGAVAQVRDLGFEPQNARRIALVIGNDLYSPTSVRTAVNDANLIAQSMRSAGFDVRQATNTRLPELEKAIDDTVSGLHRGDTVLIYYSGLCLGIGSDNYLVPIDFKPRDPADAKYTTYSVSRMMDRLESAGAGVVVLFLDASRKNPFGLGEPVRETPVAMGAGAASHLILAASPGKTAFDIPESRNSLFAGFLADALGTAGITISDLFMRVQEKVYAASGGAQAPVISSGADTRVRLLPETIKSSAPAFEPEFQAWQKAWSTSLESEIRNVLSRFPDGAFRDALNARLQSTPPVSSSLVEPPGVKQNLITTTKSTPERIEKMARLTKPEVDPNFSFVTADMELLVEADAYDQRLRRDGLVEEDPALEAYINQVGQSILPSLEPPPKVRWQFHVLRDPALNAFALPNGSIYVNSGLLAALDNESQLAGVLAHEITHVTGRHGYYANRDYRKKSTTVSIVQMIAAYSPTGSDSTSTMIRSASQLAAKMIPAILNASILGYARELERNADLYAIEKLVETGYDPREMLNAFRHLQEKHEVELATCFYNDHPKLEDRINYTQVALASKGITDSPMYASQQKRFREETRKVSMANVRWTFMAGLRRTAVARARKLLDLDANSVDAVLSLADSYRALGPWTAQIQPQELTNDAKKKALKAKLNLTAQEAETERMKSPDGQSAWNENARAAEELYKKALTMNPERAEIYMSLGQLFEKSGDLGKATASFRSFLNAAPTHPDAVRVQRKLEILNSGLPSRR